MKRIFFVSLIGFVIIGCSQQPKKVYQFSCGESYSSNNSVVSVENLIQSMESAARILSIQNIGYQAGMRLDYNNYSKGLVCNSEYNKLADDNIKKLAKDVKNKVKGVDNKKLVADAYSKWLTYLESISPKETKGDNNAKYDFQLSINKLKAISL